MSWGPTTSGVFESSLIYYSLVGRHNPSWVPGLWATRVPLKIRIFLWQLARGLLPSGNKVMKRNGTGDGLCPLCGVGEDGSHIFFSCVAAQFLWSYLHEALGCSWFPVDMCDLVVIAECLTGRRRRLLWFSFAAMAWALWTSRNKLVIAHEPLRHATDLIYISIAFMQQ